MDTASKNIIIGGSTKCGTTSLFRYLSSHPQICPSLIKETRFFWSGDYPLAQQKLNGKSVANYDDFFLNCTKDQWRLEATPDYLYSVTTADKIKSQLPDCRFVFILRQPSDRIKSWFKYSKQTGRIGRDTGFDEYLHLLKATDSPGRPQHLRALEQGRYGNYLQSYIDLFGRQSVLITFYKDLTANPGLYMSGVCEFLKIDKTFYNNFDFKIYNPSVNVKNPGQLDRYNRLKKILRSYNNKLPQAWGKAVRKVLKSVDSYYMKNKATAWEEIKISQSALSFMNEYYKEDTILLEKLLGRKITW